MKTGCFLKGFIISTVLLAVVLYIAINKFDDYLAKPVKKYLVEVAKDEFIKELDIAKLEVSKDSVSAFLNRAGETVIALPGLGSQAINSFADSLGRVFADQTITAKEFERLNYLLEELKQNEK
ncbi:MAG: hypothetical protein AMXMBFR48_00280 [Ignavibacteriales bacterium]